MIKLWRKNSLGLGTWKIWANGNLISYAHSSTEGGAEIIHHDIAMVNQSGRTLDEQVQLEIASRISRQLDKGYKRTREEALLGSTNQLGLFNPMLALPIDKVQLPSQLSGYVQRKYDGHRCLITRQGGELIAYSRKGKIIDTIGHVLTEVDRWLPEGATLDGELYVHGMKLQQIASIVKREQDGNALLNYHWYDVVLPAKFDDRLHLMRRWAVQLTDERISMVDTYPVTSVQQVYEYFKQFQAEGYEGAMLRMSVRGYEDAKRSNQLLKVKSRLDGEVTVLGVKPSKDGWAICQVITDWGARFDISAPGSVTEKTEVLQHAQNYIGKRLTIEYADLTKERVPFHAVAIRWREDI